MADYDSNLPIFSRATTNPVIVSKDTTANATSNPLYVELTDGTSALGITSGALDVNVTNASIVVTASDLDIRNLVSSQDEVALGDGTNQLDFVVINSAFGATPTAIPIAGKYEATATTYDDGDAVPLQLSSKGAVFIGDIIPGIGANNLGKAEDAIHTSGDVGVMALAVRRDAASPGGADGDYVSLSTDSTGALRTTASLTIGKTDDSAFTIGSDEVIVNGYIADETVTDSVDEGDVGAARMTLDRKQLMVITDATTDANRLAIDASGYITSNINGSVTVTATDLDIRDLSHLQDSIKIGDGTEFWSIDSSGYGQVDIAAQSLTALKISKDTNANSETNPIYVHNVNSTSGYEIHDYDTASSVASGTVSNHDYVVTNAKTFLLKKIIASASGAIKVVVGYGASGATTVATGFTSMANPTLQIPFEPAVEVSGNGTDVVRVARTNREYVAMDVYSTIMGSEI